MIIKNVIKTCSCFIDRSVWFINLSQKQVVNPFYFEMSDFENGNRIADIVENKFIKQRSLLMEELYIKTLLLFLVMTASSFNCF